MTDKQIDELIERALKAEQTLPEGLGKPKKRKESNSGCTSIRSFIG